MCIVALFSVIFSTVYSFKVAFYFESSRRERETRNTWSVSQLFRFPVNLYCIQSVVHCGILHFRSVSELMSGVKYACSGRKQHLYLRICYVSKTERVRKWGSREAVLLTPDSVLRRSQADEVHQGHPLVLFQTLLRNTINGVGCPFRFLDLNFLNWVRESSITRTSMYITWCCPLMQNKLYGVGRVREQCLTEVMVDLCVYKQGWELL